MDANTFMHRLPEVPGAIALGLCVVILLLVAVSKKV